MKSAVVLSLVAFAAIVSGCASLGDGPRRHRPAETEVGRRCAATAEMEREQCRRYNHLNEKFCIAEGRRPGERVVLSEQGGDARDASLSRYSDAITCSASALDCQLVYDNAYLSCRVDVAKQ